MAKGVLIAALDFSSVATDEFNDWYDSEHIPDERQRVPGFLTLQRWIGAENPGSRSRSISTTWRCCKARATGRSVARTSRRGRSG